MIGEDATGQLIVANLDAEHQLAGQRQALPMKVRTRISAASTLLRAFGSRGGRLWTLEPVDPRRLGDALDLPHPRLESGWPPRLGGERVLAWAVTPAICQLGAAAAPPPRSTAQREDTSLAEQLWNAPWPTPEATRQASDRTYQLELARRLGLDLPQAAIVTSFHALERHLARAASPRWVLKAPFSAAGRDRVHGRGTEVEGTRRRQAEALLGRFGALVFEPWLERTADFSGCAIAQPAGPRLIGLQRLEVDRLGGFKGILVTRDEAGLLSSAERTTLERVFEEVGKSLLALGFRGPFGIDAWRYRRADGREALHAMGEINPRLTFGWVARALAERVWQRHPEVRTVQLRFGPQAELPPPSSRFVHLLAPDVEGTGAAWLAYQ